MGQVKEIHVGQTKRGDIAPADQVEIEKGRGIVGDRYHTQSDEFDKVRHVTFIEQETIDALQRDYDIPFSAKESRRNIATSGVALNHLIDKTFKVGDVEFRGTEMCEPCKPLEQMTGKQVFLPLKHRGGIRAEALTSGTIKCGDTISS